MKFYLSSYNIPTPDSLIKLINKPAIETNVGIILNARDYYSNHVRIVRSKKIFDYLNNIGFNVSEVDLRNYNNPLILKTELMKYDLLWVCGGNTFVLREAMKNSGLDQIIKDVLESGVVYGGDSSGAVVTENSIKDIEIADQPEFAKNIIWDGLGLIDKFIIPHIDSPDPNMQTAIQKIIQLHKDDPKVVLLKDNQALIIDNQRAYIDG